VGEREVKSVSSVVDEVVELVGDDAVLVVSLLLQLLFLVKTDPTAEADGGVVVAWSSR
jgi:hypothetical protein